MPRNPYVQLLRPLNCLMSSLAVFIGAFASLSLSGMNRDNMLNIGLACLVAFIFTGAGNALNDFNDRFVDKVAHPERPIPSRRIKGRAVLRFSALLFVLCLPLAIFTDFQYLKKLPLPFIIVILNMAVMLSYEKWFKRKGLSGNFCIAWLTGSLFLFGGSAVNRIEVTIPLAVLAIFASLGREVVKDIEDMKGDRGYRRTLPMNLGKKKAGGVAALAFILSISFSPLPYLLNYFPFAYISFVAMADVTFIYCILILFSDPGYAQKVAKLGMGLALMSFLVGGLGGRL